MMKIHGNKRNIRKSSIRSETECVAGRRGCGVGGDHGRAHNVGGANKEDAVMAEGGVGGGGDCVGDLLSQFRCLGTTDRDVLINDLHSILGGRITREQCVFVLEMSNW